MMRHLAVMILMGLGVPACAERADPSTFNCGRFDSEDWRAPEGCVCTDPAGRTSWQVPGGQQEPLTCEDPRLQACPSTSGSACALVGMEQWPAQENEPSVVVLHHDIGGHLHDLCCAQHYSGPSSIGFSTTCNGCTAQHPDGVASCEDTTAGDALLGLPFNPQWPCAVEWRYATTAAFRGPFVWWAPHDTSLRYTYDQVIERGMANVSGPYVRPDGEGGAGVPLYGRALRATTSQPYEQRAPAGTKLGNVELSAPFHPARSSLGLSAVQIGSFCESESAAFDDDTRLWSCVTP